MNWCHVHLFSPSPCLPFTHLKLIVFSFILSSSCVAQTQAKEDTTFSYDPPKPTVRPFVGLALDLKQLGRRYKADLLSCFHWQCLLAIFFTFISCIAPAVAFGGLLQEITENRIGVSEIVMASGVAGIIMGHWQCSLW